MNLLTVYRVRGLVILLALVVSGSALADVEFYAGAGIGRSDSAAKSGELQGKLVSQGFDVTGVRVDAESAGWRFLTGVQFTDLWAVELGFVDLGDIETQVDANVALNQTAQFQRAVANAVPVMPRGMTLAGVARFNLGQLGDGAGPTAANLSIAVKLGVIDADSDRRAAGVSGNKSVNADPYYGLIVGYDFSDTWRGVLGFEVFNLGDSTNYWSAGLEFKFPTYASQ